MKFESEQQKETQDRLNKLSTSVQEDKQRLAELEGEKNQLLIDKQRISDEITEKLEKLGRIKKEFDVKTDAVNSAKKQYSQLSKEIDKMMKEIINKVKIIFIL